MTLPRKPGDRRRPAGAVHRADPQSREVQPPELYVAVNGSSYYGQKYAKARIRIRKGCYCYLVWRDGEATREFYLGKRERRTPQDPAGAGELERLARALAARSTRGTK